MAEKAIGKIVHFYAKIGVGIVELKGTLKVGEKIKVVSKEGTEKLEQEVTSMQIEHENVESAKKGQVIGLKVDQVVKEGDQVYLVKE